jgi:hypothetical protein
MLSLIKRAALMLPTRGVSIFDQPDGLERFGGAYLVGVIPESLQIVKIGRNPHHFEIAPASLMTFETHEAELAKISLTPL